MGKKMIFVLVVCLGLAGFCQAGYTAWENEYDGSAANTVCLWNFNTGDLTTAGTSVTNQASGASAFGRAQAFNYGNTSFAAGGKFGNAAQLPGGTVAGDQINIWPNATSIFPTGTDPSLTVETWVKFDDKTQAAQFLIDKQYADSEMGGYRIYYYGGADHFIFSIGDGTKQIKASASNLSISNGQWYHVAGTWDAVTDTATLYLDGEVVASTVSLGSSLVDAPTRPLKVGNRIGSSYAVVNGMLDGVRISDTAYNFVPEPATMALLAFGSLAMLRRKR